MCSVVKSREVEQVARRVVGGEILDRVDVDLLVVPGGFVIIDDYGYWEGCRRAVDEFLAARGLNVTLVTVDDSGVWFEVPA